MKSPDATSRDTPFSASKEPKLFFTPTIDIFDDIVLPPLPYFDDDTPHKLNRYLRTAKTKINDGTTRKTPPASLKCRGDSLSCASRYALSGRFWLVRTAAAKTSFQEMTNEKIAIAANPGNANGNTTRIIACRREQPSVQAASSYSFDMPRNRL